MRQNPYWPVLVGVLSCPEKVLGNTVWGAGQKRSEVDSCLARWENRYIKPRGQIPKAITQGETMNNTFTNTLTVNVNVDKDGDNGWIDDEGKGLAEAIADLLDGAGITSGTVTVNL